MSNVQQGMSNFHGGRWSWLFAVGQFRLIATPKHRHIWKLDIPYWTPAYRQAGWTLKNHVSLRSFSPWSDAYPFVPPREIMYKTSRRSVTVPTQTIDFQ